MSERSEYDEMMENVSYLLTTYAQDVTPARILEEDIEAFLDIADVMHKDVEEVSKVLKDIRKHHREYARLRDSMAEELWDVIWYLSGRLEEMQCQTTTIS